jgi:hypothetical protein
LDVRWAAGDAQIDNTTDSGLYLEMESCNDRLSPRFSPSNLIIFGVFDRSPLKSLQTAIEFNFAEVKLFFHRFSSSGDFFHLHAEIPRRATGLQNLHEAESQLGLR